MSAKPRLPPPYTNPGAARDCWGLNLNKPSQMSLSQDVIWQAAMAKHNPD